MKRSFRSFRSSALRQPAPDQVRVACCREVGFGVLSLAVLGPPEVRHVGRLLTFPTRKTLALLVYLAVQGGRQPREKLTALFWPESDQDRGRAALRQTLALLGDALRTEACLRGQHLIVRRDALAFDFGSEFALDVAGLASGLIAQPQASSPSDAAKLLPAIVEQYRGDFLEGFSLTDAPDFDAWASVQREAYHRRMDAVFDRLSAAQAHQLDLEAAIDTTARWVAHDRLSETAHRRLIQLYASTGDRGAALRAFETCRLILAEELGVLPDSETEAIAERVRSSAGLQPRRQAQSTLAAGTLPVVEVPLIGRARERAVLNDAFQAVVAGETRAVVIRGEAGIGKTRLASEFLQWASREGADVLEGRAFETGDRLPYLPVVEALRARLRMEPELRSLVSPIWLSELARVLPEVHDRCPDLPPPPYGQETEARARLFEAVSLLGQALAGRAPTVLLVDDVQWTDTASLDLLGYLARAWRRSRTSFLLVLALRGEDVPTAPALGEWLAGLERTLPTTSVSLGPLTADNTRDLVEALCGATLQQELGTWVFAETRGQPFYIVETLKSLAERGLLKEGQGIDRSASRGFMPPSVRDLIRVRVDRLSTGARQALAAAAVLGPRFAFDHLWRVADQTESECLTAFDELLARHFIQEADEIDRFTFAHDKVREVVYAEAGEPRRQVLHRRAMDVLAAQGAAPGTLARHAQAAGQPVAAFAYYLAAGDGALRVFAGRDAIAQYEQARELLIGRAVPVGDGQAARHLYEHLGHACELVGDYAVAHSRYQEMLALARTAARPEIEIAALNRLASLAVQGALNLTDAMGLLGSAQQRVETSGDRVGRTNTELNLAQLHVYRWDLDTAIDHAERALALARELGLEDHVARSLSLLALAENTHGKVAEAEGHAQEGRKIAIALGNRALEADCVSLLAEARIRLGRPQEGIADARVARALSLQIGDPYLQARSAHKLAIGLMDAGEYEATLEAAGEGVTAARASGTRAFLILDLVALGNAQRELWLQDEALATHREALAINNALEVPIYTELISSVLCADQAVAGDWRAAVGHARRALAVREHAYLYTGLYRWFETEALVRGGQADEAAEDLRRMDERIGTNRRYRLPYLRALSVLDRWRDDIPSAVRHLESAATLAADMGMPGQEWQVRASLVDLYTLQGDAIRARVIAERVRALQRQLSEKIAEPGLRARFLAAPPPLPLRALDAA